MFCDKCGKEIADDAVICIGCGRSLQPIKGTLPQIDRQVKRANLGLLLSAVISSFIISIIGLGIAVSAGPYDEGMAVIGGGIILLALAAGILGAVLFCIYLYRAWEMLQDGYARTTPGKAVGFGFIPFFNFYWVFQSLWGWSKDYNSFIQRNAISNAPKMPEGLFLAWAILIILASIPVINWVACLPTFIVALIGTIKICKAINFFADRSRI
jgi:hypothetical protein